MVDKPSAKVRGKARTSWRVYHEKGPRLAVGRERSRLDKRSEVVGSICVDTNKENEVMKSLRWRNRMPACAQAQHLQLGVERALLATQVMERSRPFWLAIPLLIECVNI